MRKGFTLIELLIVIAVLAIVVSLIFSNCQSRDTSQVDNWDPYKYTPPAPQQSPTKQP
jgi:prepilin-type N-terminal cleavage/methylation domain-containing protein